MKWSLSETFAFFLVSESSGRNADGDSRGTEDPKWETRGSG